MPRIFLRKSVLLLSVSLLFSPACFAEKSYAITESELTEIQTQTSFLMLKVEELTESVRTLEKQRNQYLTLSNELRQENEKLKTKVKRYQMITTGVVSGAVIGGLTAYMLRR